MKLLTGTTSTSAIGYPTMSAKVTAGLIIVCGALILGTTLVVVALNVLRDDPFTFTRNTAPGWHSVDVKTRHVDDVLDKLGPECDIKFTDGAYRGSTVVAYTCTEGE